VDDDKISDRQIAFVVDNVRAVLLRQQYDKGQSLSDNHIQHIKCIDVEEVDTSFDSMFPSDCKVYKTRVQIPKPIETHQKDLITSVGPSEFGSIGYEFIPYARFAYARSTRFKRPLAVFFNQYIYIIDAGYTPQVNVSGVFEQPNALSSFSDCSGTTCFDWDSPYPISSHLIDPLTKMCIEQLSIEIKVPFDKTNDSNQKLEDQSK
jgi:hypothetical protein